MDTRLIEVAFPLKQASLDSVHEKMCHARHPKALHLWPARRPLAASRAALIATLLPDPGTAEGRRALVERIGGKVVTGADGKEHTEGGILHWGRESSPDLQWFREEIRKAYGGRAPRVMDPFAGGGAIPLEAMRLGCAVTAVDINPVAWFILKCTLEYPQRLAGQTCPLPDFVRSDRDFLTAFFKARGLKGRVLAAQVERIVTGASSLPSPRRGGAGGEVSSPQLAGMESADLLPEADLAWHVRAWGAWVLERAKRELDQYYPTVGGKPPVAYLWARTVTCKACRATVPLLKSLWIRRKRGTGVAFTIQPNLDRTGVVLGLRHEPAQQRGSGHRTPRWTPGRSTMSNAGATCPCCGTIMTMEDLRLESQAGHVGQVMTCVVEQGSEGKTFRLPLPEDLQGTRVAEHNLGAIFERIPYGVPLEPTPDTAGTTRSSSKLRLYGILEWRSVFTTRQLATIGTLATLVRTAVECARQSGYPDDWAEAILCYLACIVDKIADYNSARVNWQPQGVKGSNTFVRWAFPPSWDFVENNILESDSGGWAGVVEWVTAPLLEVLPQATREASLPAIRLGSSAHQQAEPGTVDAIVTDPPYYGAIMYSDLMDFFHIWLRRMMHDAGDEFSAAFASPLGPKWSGSTTDSELVDDPGRHNWNFEESRRIYEDGMRQVFESCKSALRPEGRLVIVFAHKDPVAWETLVSSLIHAGFLVDGSWPIQTEMSNRTRSMSSAALSSSVWLVCKKRPANARPGWDNVVIDEMRHSIVAHLRTFWDAGIRGPDFVWAATGPALEAYSQYPAVKKADEPGQVMTVAEFLAQARRIVVEFVVGRVLGGEGGGEDSARDLDAITTYYLLHRHDFEMEAAPVGPCILYAVSCGLSDGDLTGRYDLLARGGGSSASATVADDANEDVEGETEEDGEGEVEERSSGATVKLKAWDQRKRIGLAADGDGRPIPLIDRTHRLMQLWRAGDVHAVDEYLDTHGLRRSTLFHHLLQALIELAAPGSEERSLLESISNHVNARSTARVEQPALLPNEEE